MKSWLHHWKKHTVLKLKVYTYLTSLLDLDRAIILRQYTTQNSGSIVGAGQYAGYVVNHMTWQAIYINEIMYYIQRNG